MLSLVTACMNRESHLRQSLPHWLTLPDVDEIVIVDWSTSQSLHDLLALDPRVRIVRAEDESRWILSYAYNLGIQHARGDTILKCDADCLPHPHVTKLRPSPGAFFAGDWSTGDLVGKTCVNGQCVFTRDQWRQVNGYSEVIRRYGFDDTDFYQRLVAAGHQRTEISPSDLDFCQHDDADRVANHGPVPAKSLDEFLHRQLHYHEAINMVIISFLPWGPWFPRAQFEMIEGAERFARVRRLIREEIPISKTLQDVARSQAMRSVTARLCKLPSHITGRMDEAACARALARFISPASPPAVENGVSPQAAA